MHQLLFQGKRATAALGESGGETFTVGGDQIILSAGAIGSPQLLMLSGVGPAEHLEGVGIPVVLDSPAVGQNLRDHPKREAVTFSHISGTCRMGPSSDPMAVVDQYGRVHGLEGLRVADASIMPDLVRAPINPAVLMLGERIADLVRQGL